MIPQRWEYKLVSLTYRSETRLAKLNSLGEQGWEAVAVENGYALCKRPLGRADEVIA